jgi:hypothetical protein
MTNLTCSLQLAGESKDSGTVDSDSASDNDDDSPKSEFPDNKIEIDFSASAKTIEFKATRANRCRNLSKLSSSSMTLLPMNKLNLISIFRDS